MVWLGLCHPKCIPVVVPRPLPEAQDQLGYLQSEFSEAEVYLSSSSYLLYLIFSALGHLYLSPFPCSLGQCVFGDILAHMQPFKMHWNPDWRQGLQPIYQTLSRNQVLEQGFSVFKTRRTVGSISIMSWEEPFWSSGITSCGLRTWSPVLNHAYVSYQNRNEGWIPGLEI